MSSSATAANKGSPRGSWGALHPRRFTAPCQMRVPTPGTLVAARGRQPHAAQPSTLPAPQPSNRSLPHQQHHRVLRHGEATASPGKPCLCRAGFGQDVGSERHGALSGPWDQCRAPPAWWGHTRASCPNPARSDLPETQQTHRVPAASLSPAAGSPPPPTSPPAAPGTGGEHALGGLQEEGASRAGERGGRRGVLTG